MFAVTHSASTALDRHLGSRAMFAVTHSAPLSLLSTDLDDSDALAVLFSKLDSTVLAHLPLQFDRQTQHAWYQQTRSLSGLDINWDSDVDWKHTHATLTHALASPVPLSHPHVFASPLVTQIALDMGHDSGVDEALYLACANGHTSTVQLLLADGQADPTVRNSMSVRLASENGHKDIVRLLLLDRRADPRACDNWALRGAVEGGHYDVIRLLLRDGRVKTSISPDERPS